MSETSIQANSEGRLNTTNPSKPNPTCTTTEPSTPDLRTTPPTIHYRLFPLGTTMVGPVVILQGKPRPMVLISNKLIFPDGTQIVAAVETRALWGGADGCAYDADPATKWKIAASVRNGIIVNSGNIQ
jgi:hypothetical protein